MTQEQREEMRHIASDFVGAMDNADYETADLLAAQMRTLFKLNDRLDEIARIEKEAANEW